MLALAPQSSDSGPSASSNNKAVLEDIVKAIDAVARPNGPPLSSASPTGAISATPAVPPTPATAASMPKAPAPSADGQPPGDNKVVVNTVQETNGAVRSRRFSDAAVAAAVGTASGGGGATKGINGNTSSAGADDIQPGGAGGAILESVGAREGIIAAAAEVNGVGKGAGDTPRSSEEAEGPPAEASSGASTAPAGPQGGGAGAKTVTAEQEAPPVSMAEVSLTKTSRGTT